MLVAPFSASPCMSVRALPRPKSKRIARPPIRALIGWSIAGLMLVLLVPAARGGQMLGATLPFWLVAAPLIDLAWIERRRIARSARDLLRRFARPRRMARSVGRQRLPLAWRAARS